jgi:hypothetical protein
VIDYQNGAGQAVEERRSYTTKLQRRAQAHITAELGRDTIEDGLDRQVVMLVQHALDATHARRVSLIRPIPRGRRWHIVTAYEDGSFHYGLVASESLALPMVAFTARKPLIVGPDRPFDAAAPFPITNPTELGIKSYLGLPLLAGPDVVAVLEVVNIAQPDSLERHVQSLEPALDQLTLALSEESETDHTDNWASQTPASAPDAVSLDEVCDLVLRPAGDPDDPFEIVPDEWKLLLQLDGERRLAEAVELAQLTPTTAAGLAARLLEKGLIRIGRESRRRG